MNPTLGQVDAMRAAQMRATGSDPGVRGVGRMGPRQGSPQARFEAQKAQAAQKAKMQAVLAMKQKGVANAQQSQMQARQGAMPGQMPKQGLAQREMTLGEMDQMNAQRMAAEGNRFLQPLASQPGVQGNMTPQGQPRPPVSQGAKDGMRLMMGSAGGSMGGRPQSAPGAGGMPTQRPGVPSPTKMR